MQSNGQRRCSEQLAGQSAAIELRITDASVSNFDRCPGRTGWPSARQLPLSGAASRLVAVQLRWLAVGPSVAT
jgi:hypothetical protein